MQTGVIVFNRVFFTGKFTGSSVVVIALPSLPVNSHMLSFGFEP
jgi:hypothetical protein